MLGLTVKTTTPIDIGTFISEYVASNFEKADVAQVKSGCAALNTQRSALLAALDNNVPLPEYNKAFISYMSSFYLASRRFPFGDDGRTGFLGHRMGKVRGVHARFTYVDALCPAREGSSSDPRYEVACQIFNYAGRLSREALAAKSRGDLTEACKHFREAAGAFEFLSQPKFALNSVVTKDITPSVVSFFSTLMLAQAQVCIFEKATQNDFSPDLIAKIASDAHQKFTTAVTRITNDDYASSGTGDLSLQKYFNVCTFAWGANAGLQAAYYAAQATFWQARAAFGNRKWGNEIGYLRIALAHVESTRRFDPAVKVGNPSALVSRDALSESIRGRLLKAEQSNNSAYFDAVPNTMPVVPGQSMAASISFEPIWETVTSTGTDEFRSLTDPAVRAAAAAIAAELSKTALAAAAAGNARSHATRERLSAMGVALDVFERAQRTGGAGAASPSSAVPDDLWQRISDFRSRGGVVSLKRSARDVEAAAKDASDRVQAVKRTLAAEEAGDKAVREQFKGKWTRLPSSQLASSMNDTVTAVEGLIADAAAANSTVIAELSSSEAAMKTLEQPREALAAALPRPVPAAAASAGTLAAATALRAALDEVAAVVSERERRIKATGLLAGVPAEGAGASPGAGSGSDAGSEGDAAHATHAPVELSRLGSKIPEGQIDVVGRLTSAGAAGQGREQAAAAMRAEVEASAAAIAEVNAQEDAALTKAEAAHEKFAASVAAQPGADDFELKDVLKRLYSTVDAAAKLGANLDEGRRFYSDLARETLVPLKERADDFVVARDIEKRVHIDDITAQLGQFSLSTTPSGVGAAAGAGPGAPGLNTGLMGVPGGSSGGPPGGPSVAPQGPPAPAPGSYAASSSGGSYGGSQQGTPAHSQQPPWQQQQPPQQHQQPQQQWQQGHPQQQHPQQQWQQQPSPQNQWQPQQHQQQPPQNQWQQQPSQQQQWQHGPPPQQMPHSASGPQGYYGGYPQQPQQQQSQQQPPQDHQQYYGGYPPQQQQGQGHW